MFATIAKTKRTTFICSYLVLHCHICYCSCFAHCEFIELPVSWFKSYSWYAGVQDALVQWWYGHNAVAFFLTTPYLGLMYYFLPKAANRPVYSYRLSIIHFWALIFFYIWAGPHHLLYTALPNWAQSLGVVFSFMLIFPSWGGMINGLLTLRGAWDKVRDDVILKFMVVAVTAYGMATFEGPMLSLKSVNAISALYRLDYCTCAYRCFRLEWYADIRSFILADSKNFQHRSLLKKDCQFHFWLAYTGDFILCNAYVLGRVYTKFYVETIH